MCKGTEALACGPVANNRKSHAGTFLKVLFLGFCSLICSWFFLSSLWLLLPKLLFLCLPLKCGHFLGLFPNSFAFSPFLHCPGHFHQITFEWLSDLHLPPGSLLWALGPLVGLAAHVWLFATPWPIARQAPLSMGVSRQECWSGLPCPPSGALPDPGMEPRDCRRVLSQLSRQGSPGNHLPIRFPSIFAWETLCLTHTGIMEKLFKKIVMPESHPTETDLIALGCVTWASLFFFIMVKKHITGNIPN